MFEPKSHCFNCIEIEFGCFLESLISCFIGVQLKRLLADILGDDLAGEIFRLIWVRKWRLFGFVERRQYSFYITKRAAIAALFVMYGFCLLINPDFIGHLYSFVLKSRRYRIYRCG